MREDRDLSQAALAKLLNVSQSTYSRYESGYLDIPSNILIALARFYQVSVDYILAPLGSGKPPQHGQNDQQAAGKIDKDPGIFQPDQLQPFP